VSPIGVTRIPADKMKELGIEGAGFDRGCKIEKGRLSLAKDRSVCA
jgi:hypothetical protein